MRYRFPVLAVSPLSLPSGCRLFCMVPSQKRPRRSHLPSFERFAGRCASGSTSRTWRSVSGSQESMPPVVARIRPPFSRIAIEATISGIFQVTCSPVDGFQRQTV